MDEEEVKLVKKGDVLLITKMYTANNSYLPGDLVEVTANDESRTPFLCKPVVCKRHTDSESYEGWVRRDCCKFHRKKGD